MKQQILHLVNKYRLILIVLVFALLMGYGLLRLQEINNPEPDPEYVSSQESAQTTSIRVKDTLQAEIDALVDTPVDVQPEGLGRADPFNP